jgi:hypothetical protein
MSRPAVLALLAAASFALGTHAQTVGAKIVLRESQALGGSTVSAVNTPFTNGLGRMACVVALADTRRLIVDEDLTIIFDSAAIPSPALTGGEGTFGFSNTADYIYSPSIDGSDGVYSTGSPILRDTDPAPGILGVFIGFNSRPTMLPNGTSFWVAGLEDAAGVTIGRALYTNTSPGSPATTSVVIRGGDTYGGIVSSATGISFEYDISDNGLHRIQQLTVAGAPAASDIALVADNILIAREGSPAPIGNWSGTLRMPVINDSGTFVFAADTTAATTGDEIIVSNSGLVLQEGTTIGGVTLSGTVNSLSINNNGMVAFTWGTGANEGLFMGPVASLAADAVKVVRSTDIIDTNGDNVGDFTVIDLNGSPVVGPGLDLAEDGRVFLEVTLRPIGGTSADDFDAILRFPPDAPTCVADVDDGTGTGTPDGGVGIEDLLYYLGLYDAGSVDADVDDGSGTGTPDGGVGIEDLLYYLVRFEAGC